MIEYLTGNTQKYWECDTILTRWLIPSKYHHCMQNFKWHCTIAQAMWENCNQQPQNNIAKFTFACTKTALQKDKNT